MPRASEGEGVVLVGERAGKILEVVAAAGLGLRRAGRASARPVRGLTVGIATRARAARTAAEHDQLAHVDLRGVAGLAVLVLPLAVLDPALDVQLVSLLHVLLDDVRQLRALRVPHDAAMPLGLLLLRTGRVVPRTARRERERRDAITTGRRAHLGIVP